MRLYLLILFTIFVNSALRAEFYLDQNSEYCQNLIDFGGYQTCQAEPGELNKQINVYRSLFNITPKDSHESMANIIRLQFFEEFSKPLRRRLMLSNALGHNPRSFLEQFKTAYSRCENYSNEIASIVEYSTGGLTIFESKEEQEKYKTALVKRYQIALLEILRLNICKKKMLRKELSVEEIDQNLSLIYQEYPTLKTILAITPRFPRFIYVRLAQKIKNYDTYASCETTHPKTNDFLGFPPNSIFNKENKSKKRQNFYELAYDSIVKSEGEINDSWMMDKIIESDVQSTQKTISLLGDICQMSACDIIQTSPDKLKSILSQTIEHNKIEVEKYICEHCELGEKRTFSNFEVIAASLGALGAGVGCVFSAPICIPAAILGGGVAYMSFKHYQDTDFNEQELLKLTQYKSVLSQDSGEFEVSLRELEETQHEKTSATFMLLLDSAVAFGEVAQGVKVTKNLLSNIVKTNRTVRRVSETYKLYRGSALKDIPSEALDIFLKTSRAVDYVPSSKEMAVLKSHGLLDTYNSWKKTNKVVRNLNEKMAILFRSKVQKGDEKIVLTVLKSAGKILFPVYKSFQFNNRVKRILNKILLNPSYKLSVAEKSFLKSKGYLKDVVRFQDDARIGLQSGFAKIEKVRNVAGKVTWGVTLGAVGANLFVDEYMSTDESFNEKLEGGMSRYDDKVELIFTSPMPHVSVRIGGLVYNYGVMNVTRNDLDAYKASVGFGKDLSGNHIRIELDLTKEEKKKLIKYLEEDVGKAYPLALPFVDCISQTNKAIKHATGIDVPPVMDRSQALSISYYNFLKLTGNKRVKKVVFASSGNSVLERTKESAINIVDSLMFTRYAPMMILTTPVLDQYRLTIDPDTNEFK